ncbi:MAG: hypothetical protein A4E49_01352 [Methanosaeta sp. PtaU1.Bin112]|nr:MAG: hypothetical protein A4E49_01352 [Methanosaeta sp. PtaU1.Bin112]
MDRKALRASDKESIYFSTFSIFYLRIQEKASSRRICRGANADELFASI